MKKSVILVIAVIYLLAIVIVGFLGIRMKVYNEVIYIEEIVCDENEFPPCDASVPYQKGLIEEGFDRYVEKTYEEGLSVQIKCFFSPRNANAFPDGKPFEYIYEAGDDKYTVEPQGDGTCIIRFKQSAVCDVTVKTQDGSNKKLKIRVNALGGWSEYF